MKTGKAQLRPSLGQLFGMVQTQALVVSMKEIFGWLLIVAFASLTVILLSYGSVRPFCNIPKMENITANHQANGKD